jgi:Rrf2 family protein
VKIPQKADYALRAMLDLALQGDSRRAVRSAEIAARAGIPDKYLEAILVELGRAGLIVSRRGPEGGHWLNRAPVDIAAAQIYAAVDGPLRLTPGQRRGSTGVDEAVTGLWSRVHTAVREVLDGTSLDDLRRLTEGRRNVLDFNI